VDNFVDKVGRLRVRGRVRGFEAASLIHGNVDNHCAWFHKLEIFPPDQTRRACPANEDRADDQVSLDSLVKTPSLAA
jgi:hypothetical protein